ncbi:MAG: serine dehydratase beta chain [Lactobacillus sp.]|nr:serine dehydratase beta chain [Lactobacillus sp.]
MGIYRSVFDIIGPIMIGPSSSHTAGAVAIGRIARTILPNKPTKVIVHYYESFAKTHQGHGTDYAICAGILGYSTSDERVPESRSYAKKEGIDIRFVEEDGSSPISHPNTAIVDLTDGEHHAQIAACSVGGGVIEVRKITLLGRTITPTGPLPIVILLTKKEADGEQFSNYLESQAPFSKKAKLDADGLFIFEYDIKEYLTEKIRKELAEKFPGILCL